MIYIIHDTMHYRRIEQWLSLVIYIDILSYFYVLLCIREMKSPRIRAREFPLLIEKITNFSCVNPSRRNIRTHGIWIYDALLNQGFVIVLFEQKDIFDKISSDGNQYDNHVSKKVNYQKRILKSSTFIVHNIMR